MKLIGQMEMNGVRYPIVDGLKYEIAEEIEKKVEEYIALDTVGPKSLFTFLEWIRGYHGKDDNRTTIGQ